MFRRVSRAALMVVAAGSLNLAVVAPAEAQVGVAEGRRCSFASVTDPTIENGEVQTGQINGGPLVATTPGATIYMTCTIQVGAANSTHAGADSCSAASAASLQVTVLPPTLCSYLSPDGQPVYMCTTVTINGTTYYWDGTTGGPNGWSTSPHVSCNEAISQEIFPGIACNVTQALYYLLGGDGTNPVYIDGIAAIGPDGDLYIAGIWLIDCPPRNNPIPPPPGGWFPDGLVCPIFANEEGRYGPVIIEPGGDVYIDFDGDGNADPDEFFWNCPPY